jgi:hypothetical protein
VRLAQIVAVPASPDNACMVFGLDHESNLWVGGWNVAHEWVWEPLPGLPEKRTEGA